MYHWDKLFKDFHKSQMLIGQLENKVTLTREEKELNDSLWMTVDDYSPAQRAYEDKHYKPKEQEGNPF